MNASGTIASATRYAAMKYLVLATLVATAACRQATVAEVGAHGQAQAQSSAMISASERGSTINPGVVPAMSRGAPAASVPMR